MTCRVLESLSMGLALEEIIEWPIASMPSYEYSNALEETAGAEGLWTIKRFDQFLQASK